MKKSLSILVAIILVMSLFTGCNKDKKANTTSKVELTSEYENSTELVGDPNATGELKIAYFYPELDSNGDQIVVAVNKFKKLYPKVLVKVDRPNSSDDLNKYSDNFHALLSKTEAPDIAFLFSGMNIGKLIKDGLLFDLSEIMEKDPIPNINELNTSVLYDSQYNKKQCFVPISYYMPLLMTTESIQSKQSFSLKECNDYESTEKIILEMMKKDLDPKNQVTGFFGYPRRYPWISHLDLTNITNWKDIFNDSSTKKAFEQYKASFYPFYSLDDTTLNALIGDFPDKLKKETAYAGELTGGLQDIIGTYQAAELTSKPIIAPWRNENGMIQANWRISLGINNKSNNKENAYNFIKVMLSKDIQCIPTFGGQSYFYYPISNAALQEYLKNEFLTKEALGNKANKKDSRTEFINEVMELVSQTDASGIPDEYIKCISKAMEPYFKGTKSYEECVKDAESKIQAYVFG